MWGSPTFIFEFFLIFSAGRGRCEQLWDSGRCPAGGVPWFGGFAQRLQAGKDNCSNKTKDVNTCGDVLKQIQISFHRSLLRPTCVRGRKKTRKARWVFFKMSSCSWAHSKISMITGIDYFQARAQIGLVKVPHSSKKGKFKKWKRAGTNFLICARPRKTCLCQLPNLPLLFTACYGKITCYCEMQS